MVTHEKTTQDSKVEMTELVLPQHTNPLKTVFGGVVLSWVDIAASICAQRHCEKAAVTASIDAMHFLAPIQLGWIVNIKAHINYAWTTSCEVEIQIDAENPLAQEKFHTASAYVTMVAIDKNKNPTKIPKLKPITDKEKTRYEQAQNRRNTRLLLKKSLSSH